MTICRDLNMLLPSAKRSFEQLEAALKIGYGRQETATRFEVFETYRTPQRQAQLASPVTKARAFQSAHQFGLAVDFVPRELEAWSWSDKHDWSYLRRVAQQFGLDVPINWDRAHVEHPFWTNHLRWELQTLKKGP